METEQQTIEIEAVKLPLWKNLLEKMRADGLDFGKSWPVEFFETGLRASKDTPAFNFEMLELRKELEVEDGYYMRSSENGQLYQIVQAASVEDVAKGFEAKLNRYARRSIWLRSATLGNEKAKLTDDERRRMEGSLERASTRLVLLSRQTSIENEIRKHAPKLLVK